MKTEFNKKINDKVKEIDDELKKLIENFENGQKNFVKFQNNLKNLEIKIFSLKETKRELLTMIEIEDEELKDKK
jgi:septation ring formation regulator EzrA